MNHFQHENAIVESQDIGDNTRIWAFSHVLPGAKIGSDCNICDHTFIENDVIIGDRVTIKCGVQLWDALRVENDVFIGPNVTFTNDKYARSKQYPEKYQETYMEEGCSIGANATILPGIRIGAKAIVGAGSVVTHDVPPYAIVTGNPARIEGYISTYAEDQKLAITQANQVDRSTTYESGVQLIELGHLEDLRGNLTVGEVDKELPFIPKRIYTMSDVPSKHVRGAYSLKSCHRFIVCMNESVQIVCDNGKYRHQICLDTPTVGLYVPNLIWTSFYKFSKDTILTVLASNTYSSDDYLRDYAQFKEYISS